MNNLGVACHMQGNHLQSVALLEEALALRKLVLPAHHPDIATSMTCKERRDKGSPQGTMSKNQKLDQLLTLARATPTPKVNNLGILTIKDCLPTGAC
jgi:hypothetical protein